MSSQYQVRRIYTGIKICCLLVVIDVELCIGISCTGSFESNSDEVLADHPGENTITQGTIFIEDFVDDILMLIISMAGNIGKGPWM